MVVGPRFDFAIKIPLNQTLGHMKLVEWFAIRVVRNRPDSTPSALATFIFPGNAWIDSILGPSAAGPISTPNRRYGLDATSFATWFSIIGMG